MDEMLKCGEAEGECLQCRLFRVSTNPTDETADLAKLNEFLGAVDVVSVKTQYVTSKTDYWHSFVTFRSARGDDKRSKNDEEPKQASAEQEEEVDAELVEKLKEWRREESYKRGWPPYRILTNKSIEELSTRKPTIVQQLGNIRGIGKFTEENFGSDIVNIIAKHAQEKK